ncbi:unnamed protein product [Penicillium palitans]
MANRVARGVRSRTMRPDREPARSTNPNRFSFNSNDDTNGILVAIDFIDLKFDSGSIDSAANINLIDLNKVARGPIINPDDLWDPPFDSVANNINIIEFSSDSAVDSINLIELSCDNGAASPITDLDSIKISSDKDKQPADLATDVDSIDVNSKNDSPPPNNNANGFETRSSTDLIDLWPDDGGAHARYKKVIGMRPTIDLINLWSDTNILPVNMDLVDFTMLSGIMRHAYSDIGPSMSSMGSIETIDPNVDNGRIGYRSINPVESFPDFEVGSATSSPLDTVYTTKSNSGHEGQSVASFPFVDLSSPEAEVGSATSSPLNTAYATKASSGPAASVPLLAMSTTESEDGSVTSSPLDTVYTTKSNSGPEGRIAASFPFVDMSSPESEGGSVTSSPLGTVYTTKSNSGPGAGSGSSIPSVGVSNAEAEAGSVTSSPLDTVYTNSGLGAGIGFSDSSATAEAAE